jgi:hypothetical protein
MLAVSALAVMTRDDEGEALAEHARAGYGFIPVAQNKIFTVLRNPSGGQPMNPARPLVTFGMFYCVAAAVVFACLMKRSRL